MDRSNSKENRQLHCRVCRAVEFTLPLSQDGQIIGRLRHLPRNSGKGVQILPNSERWGVGLVAVLYPEKVNSNRVYLLKRTTCAVIIGKSLDFFRLLAIEGSRVIIAYEDLLSRMWISKALVPRICAEIRSGNDVS